MTQGGQNICYLGVWEQDTILTQYLAIPYENIKQIANALFNKIDTSYDHRKSFSAHHGYTFQYLVEDEVAFLTAATDGFPQRICFAFLERVKNEFFEKYAGTARWRNYRDFVKKEMEFFNSNPDADKIRGLRTKVQEVTDVMKDNIERVLERGERLEDLEQRSEALQDSAVEFHSRAKQLRCELCKKNWKLTIIIIITVIIIIAILIGILILLFK
eukprot:CAMPEP_0201548408 /NCGR_PEP_ID=MMETSP0173_2-20130828/4942_1 /ASSEMBLY_ACC=CAM_ASM_000268 /TAXON_ID=218659 /ORGANISM="Vexillifera sp., Strain DIVA3 564/2" /LENGTH=214 /DNA_ID=CAMNT_0047957781 /DNA_START=48 /DNA_END=692 /DNA_ORIENTATION=+